MSKETRIDVDLSISRSSDGLMRLRVVDCASRNAFLEVEFTPEQLMLALSGMYLSDIPATVDDLEHVGKKKVVEPRWVSCPLRSYDPKEKLQAWLLENGKETGWAIDTYLGSQGSVTAKKNGCIIRYSVYRYVRRRAGTRTA